MQPPRPSKHRGRNHQHASTSHEVCINYRVQRGSLIPRRLHSGGGWIWRWIGFSRVFTSKNIIDQPSILRDRTRDARKTGVCCGLQKKAVSYVIPTLILSFHTIEYFVPFLGTKLFHNILNYQSHNHAVLNPCRDGCLANTDQCSGQYLQYRPKCVYRYACHDNIITTGSIKTPVKN